MNKKQKILQKILGAAAIVFVALAASSCSNSTSGSNSQKAPEKKKNSALSVRSANYERNEGNNLTYRLIYSGSGNYEATAENPDIIELDTSRLNTRGIITVACKKEGRSRIKVYDKVGKKEAYSGSITVKSADSVIAEDFFEQSNVRYRILSKTALTVSVTPKISSAKNLEKAYLLYTQGTLSIPATVDHGDKTYKVKDIEWPQEWGTDVQNVEVAPDNEFMTSENGAVFSKDKKTLLWYPRGKPNAEYSVPEGVTTLRISSLFNVPELKKLGLPSTITDIQQYILADCPSLNTVICKAENPPALVSTVFQNTPIDSATLKVPANAVEAYKNAEGWKNFKTIEALP